jgi:hypothetical protein
MDMGFWELRAEFDKAATKYGLAVTNMHMAARNCMALRKADGSAPKSVVDALEQAVLDYEKLVHGNN